MSATARSGEKAPFDIFIIGGGINGAGIARDAVGRGYSVCLCEAGDFGSGTSSASTKLVHGGLRYLEHYEFRLVREALMEREVLWRMAPHIIRPLRFVLPHHSGLRPAWLLRLGLFLYDHLGGRKLLPPTRTLDLRDDEAGKALQTQYRKAFEYSDCWVEDSRLVVLNLRDAVARGADVRRQARVVRTWRNEDHWSVEVEDTRSRAKTTLRAKLIVNAAGPWVDEVLRNVFGYNDAANVRLVRGSHIVIRRKFEHDRAYIFQNSDGRVVFAIPYRRDFTLIGTTDVEHGNLKGAPEISAEETDYLCRTSSEYFAEPVTSSDIVWTYSGVRPLYDDGASTAQEATRDYVVERDGGEGQACLVNIFGGKITTYRRLAEFVMKEIAAVLGERGKPWTANATLPGGDFPVDGLADLATSLTERYPFADSSLVDQLVRRYGSDAANVLGEARTLAQLGLHFGAGLYEAEVRYLMNNEWAIDAEDVLFRRTKLGIVMQPAEREQLQTWMENHAAALKGRRAVSR